MKIISIFTLVYIFGVVGINCVLNGTKAEEGTFGYQVSLRNRKEEHFHECSGAILNTRVILTSAACMFYGGFTHPNTMLAVIGTIYVDSDDFPGIKIYIEQITSHPSFDLRTYVNDIALLRTVQQIEFTKYIQPVGLPSVDLPIEQSVTAKVSGWGFTDVSKCIQVLCIISSCDFLFKNES